MHLHACESGHAERPFSINGMLVMNGLEATEALNFMVGGSSDTEILVCASFTLALKKWEESLIFLLPTAEKYYIRNKKKLYLALRMYGRF